MRPNVSGRMKENVWIAWTNKAISDSNGNIREFLVVGMDITQRRQVENALRQVNAKLNLVSSIARHDILNRLQVIYGIVSLLQDGISDPTFSGYLKKAEESAIAIRRQIEFTADYKNMGLAKADWQNVNDALDTITGKRGSERREPGDSYQRS